MTRRFTRSRALAWLRAKASYVKRLKTANRLRDRGLHREAAEAYRAALREDGRDPTIWVQLGNMLKDTQAFDEAIETYRTALAIDDQNADGWVQLGRVLKLQGKREEALVLFSRALRLNAKSRDAANELISLGETWAVQEATGLGVPLQQELMTTVFALRKALDSAMERMPEIESLSSFARQSYSLFRHIYKVAPPPPSSDRSFKLGIVILDNDAPLAAIHRCALSITEIDAKKVQAILLSSNSESLNAWNRIAVGTGGQLLGGRRLGISALDQLSSVNWVLICRSPAMLSEWIADWIDWTDANTMAVAAFVDEDRVDQSDQLLRLRCEPMFGSVFDPFMPVDSCLAYGAIAVHGKVLREISNIPMDGIDTWWTRVVEKLSNCGAIANIPRILVTHLCLALHRVETSHSEWGKVVDDAIQQVPISVVIPTRNMQSLLERCVSSFLNTASNRSRVEILIVDNGSDDASTLSYLERSVRSGNIRKIVVDEPFNWSRLNNIAVNEIEAGVVVFANNDLEMKSQGWDDIVIRSLQDKRIGAVGAKLTYPDNTIQHAGVVFGIGGSTEHEGRGLNPSESLDRVRMRRSVSAVTGAFLACRRGDCSGFDERLPIAFNDIDFCLSLRSRGMHIVYEPEISAVHYESKSLAWAVPSEIRGAGFEAAKHLMRQKWGGAFQSDPSMNPHFARWGRPLEYIREPSMSDILNYIRLTSQLAPWKVQASKIKDAGIDLIEPPL